jgi:hypothetical protein
MTRQHPTPILPQESPGYREKPHADLGKHPGAVSASYGQQASAYRRPEPQPIRAAPVLGTGVGSCRMPAEPGPLLCLSEDICSSRGSELPHQQARCLEANCEETPIEGLTGEVAEGPG